LNFELKSIIIYNEISSVCGFINTIAIVRQKFKHTIINYKLEQDLGESSMLKLFKFLRNPSIVAVAAIVSIASYANAQTPSSMEEIERIYNEGLPNTQFDRTFDHIPEGFDSDYEYTHDDEGISIDGSASARYNLDWGKYVNTSGEEDITVLDIGAGIEGGIGLGCNGLDMGLEAMFEFDAGDILEYLPQYITTNLATEALAQIYATPLISTVMDGLKAMQNFTAEMKQSSCDMNKVMNRANEIKASNYTECVERISNNSPHPTHDGTKGGRPADAYCSDPTGLKQEIENKKNEFGKQAPIGENLATILNSSMGSTDADYSDQREYEIDGSGKYIAKEGDAPEGRIPSKGRILAMFIPDITFSASSSNSDATLAETAKITPNDAYNRASVTAKNYIYDVAEDIRDSLRRKNINVESTEREIYTQFDEYKYLVVNRYGDRDVFTDDNANNDRVVDNVDDVEKNFTNASNLKFLTFKTTKRGQEFKVGPAKGPGDGNPSTKLDEINNNFTDFEDAAKDMLELGGLCWARIKMGDSKYKWAKIHEDPSAIFNAPAKTVDDMVDNVTKCTIASRVEFLLYHSYLTEYDDAALLNSYVNYLAADAAYYATEQIIKAIDFQSNETVISANQKLLTSCNNLTSHGSNMGGVPATAAYDGQKGKPYKNCTDYAKQNALSDDKIKFMNNEKEKRSSKLETLKSVRDRAESNFNTLEKIYEKRNSK